MTKSLRELNVSSMDIGSVGSAGNVTAVQTPVSDRWVLLRPEDIRGSCRIQKGTQADLPKFLWCVGLNKKKTDTRKGAKVSLFFSFPYMASYDAEHSIQSDHTIFDHCVCLELSPLDVSEKGEWCYESLEW